MLSFSSTLSTVTLLAMLAVQPIGGCDGSSASAPVSGGVAGETAPPGGGHGRRPHPHPDRGGEHPHGGTPEPATMLLVGGSVAGYLALRRRKAQPQMVDERSGDV